MKKFLVSKSNPCLVETSEHWTSWHSEKKCWAPLLFHQRICWRVSTCQKENVAPSS